MRKRKARQRKRLVLFGSVALAVALVTTLALSLNAKSPEPESEPTPTAPAVSSIPLMSASAPVYSASTYSNTGDVVLLEGPALSDPDPEPENLGEFVLTAYCPCVKCCGEWSAEHPSRIGTDYVQKTASGTIPTAGRTIGVDPSVIPFGTTVIIRGHEYVAEDRGGAIKGNKIDIFFDDHNEALEFGRQTAEVFIINNKED